LSALLAVSVWVSVFFLNALNCIAGSFIFTSEFNKQTVTHPPGYFGNGGHITVSVGINPSSPHAGEMVSCVQNVVNTLNALIPTQGNLLLDGENNIPSNSIDFESVLLHEMGHALGLNHPNIGSEAGVSGDDRAFTRSTKGADDIFDMHPGSDGIRGSRDDSRGDDDNLNWFFTASNNPFSIEEIIDGSTYSRELSNLPGGDLFVACAGRMVSSLYGVPNTEAVMFQGSKYDEDQRRLAADDVTTFRYAMTGIDETIDTSDDYTFSLRYVGDTMSADIVVQFDDTKTGFAVTQVDGLSLSDNHMTVTNGRIYFNTGYRWFFNGLDQTEDIYVEQDLNCNGNPKCFSWIAEAIADSGTVTGDTIKVAKCDTPYVETVLVDKDIIVEIGLDGRNFESPSSLPTEIESVDGNPTLTISAGMVIFKNCVIK
jgi:hypothetical protein